jgi:transposase
VDILYAPWTDRAGRRRKRFLTPLQKYEIWVQLLRGKTTIAAAAAADEHGVDRSTILKLRMVAKQGALDALAKSRPGVRADNPDPELIAAKAHIARCVPGADRDGRAPDAGRDKKTLGLKRSGAPPGRREVSRPACWT